ncbi:MAG: radical SAM protein [Rhodospirillaceae bacterium]
MMVLHARHGTSAYIVSLKPHSIAVSVDGTRVVAWDRGGRLYSVYDDGVTWRRGLSGQMIRKRREGEERERVLLDGAAADAVVDSAAATARGTLEKMTSSAWRWTTAVDQVVAQEARALLALASRFDAAAARADAGRFGLVFGRIGILPPDQYLSLVVQATEGCSFNSCTFCDLYHEGYRVKTPEEFRQHVAGVLGYLGASASLRSRGIFLGAANALAVPMARLLPIFETLLEDLDAARRGVCAFVDGFTGARKTMAEYRLLSHLGLRRVYIGLESGHDPLLAFVRKPGSAADAVETVRAVRSAGVQAGVIVMTGLGGRRFAEGHERDTAAAINAMGLGEGDLVYFSDLVEMPSTSYPRIAADARLEGLTGAERRQQRQRIRAGLRFDAAPPQFATYDIREFTY